MEEVLLARMALRLSTASTSFRTRTLRSSCSGTASTTKSASARAAMSVTGLMRETISGLSGSVWFAFFFCAIEIFGDGFQAAVEEALFDVAQNHVVAAAGEDVGDAVTHSSGAENSDGANRIDGHGGVDDKRSRRCRRG